jgi:ABC-type sugar transport system substrate-binding protein
MAFFLLVTALVIGCEPGNSTDPGQSALRKGFPIVVLCPRPVEARWPGVRGGALRYMRAVPAIHVECVKPESDTPEALQVTLTNVLTKQPAGICLYDNDADARNPASLRPLIERLAREHIPLVTVGRQIDDPRFLGHVGVNLAEAGELLASNLHRLITPHHTYVLLHREGGSDADSNCYRRFSGVAEVQSGVVRLQEENLTLGDRNAAAVVEQLVGMYPHAALVVTLDADVWLAATPMWHEKLRGLNQDFRYATLSAAPSLWGQLGTPVTPGDAAGLVGPLDGELGYAAVELVVQALSREGHGSAPRWVPCELVTPATLGDFARRYSAAAGGLDVSSFLKGSVPRP